MRYFINADGERLAYQTTGKPTNPPVILIHGWTSFMGVWQTTVPLLEQDYFVVTLDLLGHGESDKPHDADYSITAQGRRVLALADMLGLQQFALVGHSMGGQIALTIAATLTPERVTRLVSVSGVVSGALSDGAKSIHQIYRFGRFIAFASPLIPPLVSNPYIANALYGRLWFYDLHNLPREVWQGQVAWAFDRDGITPLWKAGTGIQAWDLTPHLSKITAPTLVIFGCDDATVPISEIDVMKQHMQPPPQTALFERSGHFPMFENPDEYAAVLLPFLRDA